MNKVWRGFGYFLCLVALGFLALDIWTSINVSSVIITPIGQYWYDLSASTLNLAQAVVERYLWAPLWDPIILTFLKCPTFLLFAIPGGVILYLTRPFSVGPYKYDQVYN